VQGCSFNSSWFDPDLVQRMRPGPSLQVWTGGLGRMMEDSIEVWLCLQDHECSPAGDSFCFVYDETEKRFLPWAPNSCLHLV